MRGALARVLQHALLAVRPDDRQRRAQFRADAVLVRVVHRAGMKGDDLVVVQVGGDERLRRELSGDVLQRAGVDAEPLEPLQVGRDVLADRGHQQRVVAQQLQVVGDVAGGAAEFAPHLRREEAHVQDVQLVGEQVVPEAVRETP